MPSRSLPNLGLQAFFALGEDGWNDEMDSNLLKLSVLVQCAAIDKLNADPTTPADGDVYVFDETHPTNANAIAIRDAGAWVYVTPAEGWLIYNRAADAYLTFNGTAWVALAVGGGGGGIADAPSDGTLYGRQDGAWSPVVAGAPSPVVEKTGTTADLLAADSGAFARFTNAAAKALTVRPDATEPLPDNGEWHIRNVGLGDLTLVQGVGVTINPPSGGTLIVPQGGTVTLKRAAADVFDLMGQTVPA